jgi:uncharacterized protein YehS (DUF1456 family)
VSSGKAISTSAEKFITLLHHESYIVQIQRLLDQTQTRLDRVLRVLKQPMEAGFEVDCAVDISEPLVGRMVARLSRAVSDEELRRKLDLQAQVENRFIEMADALKEKDQVIVAQDQKLEATNRALAEALAELARLKASRD